MRASLLRLAFFVRRGGSWACLGLRRLAECAAYNGHFGCERYHPLLCSSDFDEVVWAILRNVVCAPLISSITNHKRHIDVRSFCR